MDWRPLGGVLAAFSGCALVGEAITILTISSVAWVNVAGIGILSFTGLIVGCAMLCYRGGDGS